LHLLILAVYPIERSTMDAQQAQRMNEAATRFADTLAESYRIVYGQAGEAQERQAQLAQEFFERVMERLREQTESGNAATEQLAEQARRQQEATREFAQASAAAYMDFLESFFGYYRRSAEQAGRATRP
jgi:dsDNA-specific endonuclease/ATPase MutS2